MILEFLLQVLGTLLVTAIAIGAGAYFFLLTPPVPEPEGSNKGKKSSSSAANNGKKGGGKGVGGGATAALGTRKGGRQIDQQTDGDDTAAGDNEAAVGQAEEGGISGGDSKATGLGNGSNDVNGIDGACTAGVPSSSAAVGAATVSTTAAANRHVTVQHEMHSPHSTLTVKTDHSCRVDETAEWLNSIIHYGITSLIAASAVSVEARQQHRLERLEHEQRYLQQRLERQRVALELHQQQQQQQLEQRKAANPTAGGGHQDAQNHHLQHQNVVSSANSAYGGLNDSLTHLPSSLGQQQQQQLLMRSPDALRPRSGGDGSSPSIMAGLGGVDGGSSGYPPPMLLHPPSSAAQQHGAPPLLNNTSTAVSANTTTDDIMALKLKEMAAEAAYLNGGGANTINNASRKPSSPALAAAAHHRRTLSANQLAMLTTTHSAAHLAVESVRNNGGGSSSIRLTPPPPPLLTSSSAAAGGPQPPSEASALPPTPPHVISPEREVEEVLLEPLTWAVGGVISKTSAKLRVGLFRKGDEAAPVVAVTSSDGVANNNNEASTAAVSPPPPPQGGFSLALTNFVLGRTSRRPIAKRRRPRLVDDDSDDDSEEEENKKGSAGKTNAKGGVSSTTTATRRSRRKALSGAPILYFILFKLLPQLLPSIIVSRLGQFFAKGEVAFKKRQEEEERRMRMMDDGEGVVGGGGLSSPLKTNADDVAMMMTSPSSAGELGGAQQLTDKSLLSSPPSSPTPHNLQQHQKAMMMSASSANNNPHNNTTNAASRPTSPMMGTTSAAANGGVGASATQQQRASGNTSGSPTPTQELVGGGGSFGRFRGSAPVPNATEGHQQELPQQASATVAGATATPAVTHTSKAASAAAEAARLANEAALSDPSAHPLVPIVRNNARLTPPLTTPPAALALPIVGGKLSTRVTLDRTAFSREVLSDVAQSPLTSLVGFFGDGKMATGNVAGISSEEGGTTALSAASVAKLVFNTSKVIVTAGARKVGALVSKRKKVLPPTNGGENGPAQPNATTSPTTASTNHKLPLLPRPNAIVDHSKPLYMTLPLRYVDGEFRLELEATALPLLFFLNCGVGKKASAGVDDTGRMGKKSSAASPPNLKILSDLITLDLGIDLAGLSLVADVDVRIRIVDNVEGMAEEISRTPCYGYLTGKKGKKSSSTKALHHPSSLASIPTVGLPDKVIDAFNKIHQQEDDLLTSPPTQMRSGGGSGIASPSSLAANAVGPLAKISARSNFLASASLARSLMSPASASPQTNNVDGGHIISSQQHHQRMLYNPTATNAGLNSSVFPTSPPTSTGDASTSGAPQHHQQQQLPTHHQKQRDALEAHVLKLLDTFGIHNKLFVIEVTCKTKPEVNVGIHAKIGGREFRKMMAGGPNSGGAEGGVGVSTKSSTVATVGEGFTPPYLIGGSKGYPLAGVGGGHAASSVSGAAAAAATTSPKEAKVPASGAGVVGSPKLTASTVQGLSSAVPPALVEKSTTHNVSAQHQRPSSSSSPSSIIPTSKIEEMAKLALNKALVQQITFPNAIQIVMGRRGGGVVGGCGNVTSSKEGEGAVAGAVPTATAGGADATHHDQHYRPSMMMTTPPPSGITPSSTIPPPVTPTSGGGAAGMSMSMGTATSQPRSSVLQSSMLRRGGNPAAAAFISGGGAAAAHHHHHHAFGGATTAAGFPSAPSTADLTVTATSTAASNDAAAPPPQRPPINKGPLKLGTVVRKVQLATW